MRVNAERALPPLAHGGSRSLNLGGIHRAERIGEIQHVNGGPLIDHSCEIRYQSRLSSSHLHDVQADEVAQGFQSLDDGAAFRDLIEMGCYSNQRGPRLVTMRE